MVVDDGSDIISSHMNVSPNGVKVDEGSAMEVLIQMELDLAYSSEKVLNLEILMMQVSEIASDHEILMKGPEEFSIESIEKAFQFDILSGFLNSEVKEIESFMSSLQLDIIDAHKNFTNGDYHLKDSLLNIEETLHLAEESLRNSQDQVDDIRKQSDRVEKCLASGISMLENGECFPMNSKWKLQTVDQQRHILISLEKSLAREMDFEKKLSESRHNEEELKTKLQFAEKNVYYTEGLLEEMMVKMFAAECSVEVILGNLEEFMGKFHNGDFNFISTTPGWEGMSNMEKGFIKPSVDSKKSSTINFGLNSFPEPSELDLISNSKECIATNSSVTILRKRMNVPEERPKEYETQLHLTEASIRESFNQHNNLYPESSVLENTIESLNEHVLEMQSRAESADSRYAQLMETNVELNDEVGFLRSNGAKKANFLEKKLNESNTQLEHANASLEAIEENQKMLYTSLSDMEHLIEDLKGKVSKAENRAESAEAKCVILTGTNLELNEELSFLRNRLECLEASSHQADMEKIAVAKDIGSRTRIIIELVKNLAFERERLQLQIAIITNRNKILTERFLRSESNIPVNFEEVNNSTDYGNISLKDGSLEESLSTPSQQVDESISSTIHEGKFDPAVSPEVSVPNTELVRTIDAAQLHWKYVLMAFILLLLSILSVFLFQLGHS